MTRGRLTEEDEAAREEVEDCLASLGIVRIYTDLVKTRVMAAIRMGSTNALSMAMEDLDRIDRLIVKEQKRIKEKGR
jgi:hypothetical protein